MFNEGIKITVSSLLVRFAAYVVPFVLFGFLSAKFASPISTMSGKLQLNKIFGMGLSIDVLYIAVLYVIFATGIITLIMGRTSFPIQAFRLWLIYHPARAAFDFSSIVTGTWVGVTAARLRKISSLDQLADPAMVALYTVLPVGFFLCTSINGSGLESRIYKVVALLASLASAFLFYQKFIV